MKNFKLGIMALTLSACQQAVEAPATLRADTAGPAAEAPADSGSDQSQPTTVQLTYFRRVKSDAPISGWITHTYTAVGSCVVYLTKTYCWDDGLQTLQSWSANSNHYGPFAYTYFGLGGTPSAYGPCAGGCSSDLLSSPRHIGVTLAANIPAQEITDIFNLGTPVAVTCTETDDALSCGDFTIDRTLGDL